MKFERNASRRIDSVESPEAFFKRDSRALLSHWILSMRNAKIPQRGGSHPEGGVSCKLRTHAGN